MTHQGASLVPLVVRDERMSQRLEDFGAQARERPPGSIWFPGTILLSHSKERELHEDTPMGNLLLPLAARPSGRGGGQEVCPSRPAPADPARPSAFRTPLLRGGAVRLEQHSRNSALKKKKCTPVPLK